MKKGLVAYFSAALAALSLNFGCSNLESSLTILGKQNEVPKEIVHEKIKRGEGCVFGIEGLQPYSGKFVHILVENSAKYNGAVHGSSSGNWGMYVPLVEEAGKYEQALMAFMGYSAGCREVVYVFNANKNKIDYAALIDPTYTIRELDEAAMIPENVRKVDIFQGENSGWWGGTKFDREYTDRFKRTGLKNARKTALEVHIIPGANHLEVMDSSIIPTEINRELKIAYSANTKNKKPPKLATSG